MRCGIGQHVIVIVLGTGRCSSSRTSLAFPHRLLPSHTSINLLLGYGPVRVESKYLETRGFPEHITVVESLLTRFPNARGDDV
jgi:hypothetical protein